MSSMSTRKASRTDAASHVDGEPELLIDRLRQHATQQGDRVAYTFLHERASAESITFAELDQQARELAGCLSAFASPGDRAVLLYASGLDFVKAFLACLYAGVIAVPAQVVRRKRAVDRLRSIIQSARPAITLTTADDAEQTREALMLLTSELPLLATDELGQGPSEQWVAPQLDASAPAFLQYTSGSTGEPKGVIVTHRNIVENERVIQAAFGFTRESVMVSWLPVFHDMGLIGGVLQALFTGFHAVLIPPVAFLKKPVVWLKAISDYRGTCTGSPDFGWGLAARAVTDDEKGQLDLSCLVTAYNGSEPVRADTLERFARAFAPCGFRREMFFPCYGMAETTLFVSGGPPLRDPRVLTLRTAELETHRIVGCEPGTPGSQPFVGCGHVWRDTRIEIVDPASCARVADGRVGEIWVSASYVCAGYWQQPDASAAVFAGMLADTEEGPFLRTGDLGFMRDRELFVTGRLKDLIIIRGRNLYPHDVERLVEREVDFVQPNMCAAFAVDREGQESLALVLEADTAFEAVLSEARLSPGTQAPELRKIVSDLSEAILREFEVAVREVAIVRPGAFPRTTSGKVQRSQCRSRLESGDLDVLAIWGDSMVERLVATASPKPTDPVVVAVDRAAGLRAMLSESVTDIVRNTLKLPLDYIEPDQPLTALGMDSLGMATLATAIEERTGVKISGDVIFECETIDGLVRYLMGATRAKAMAPPGPSPRPRHEATPSPAQPFRQPDSAPVVIAAGRSAPAPTAPSACLVLPERYTALIQRYDRMQAEGRYFYHAVIDAQIDPWIEVANRKLLMLGSYSYLGLLLHPEMAAAANEATLQFGTGAHGVRVLAGTTALHARLEDQIAAFTGSQDAIVFSSGFITNLATISTLVTTGDVVIGDEWNHASIIDGCKFSGAEFLTYKHNDMADLEAKLKLAGGRHTLVVVDAVFSMEGDICDLPSVITLARRCGALLMVDEAHSLGVLGQAGRGIQEYFGLAPTAIDIKMGCLSKALASCGGYVAGRRDLMRFIRHSARGYIFSSALPAAQVAAASKGLEILEREPERVTQIGRMSTMYRDGLKSLGFKTFRSETPIVPVSCGSEEITLEMTRLCRESGVYVAPVFYPAVPMNAARLRTCVMASHTEEEIRFGLDVLARAGRQTGLIQ